MNFEQDWQIQMQLEELERRLVTANKIIAENNRLLAKVLGPLFPEDTKTIILGFEQDR